MILAKSRYITGYEYMSRQQLESELVPPKLAMRPKKRTPAIAPRQVPRPKTCSKTSIYPLSLMKRPEKIKNAGAFHDENDQQ